MGRLEAEVFHYLKQSLMSIMKLNEKKFDKKYATTSTIKFSNKSDNWYFDVLKFIILDSGLKSGTAIKKSDIINFHFPNIETVAKYGEQELKVILEDENMIKHPGKLKSIVKNANICLDLVKEFGSVHNYLESLNPNEDLKNFYNVVKNKFAHLGEITTFQFMADIGLSVEKPDPVLSRTFERIGLIDDPEDIWEIVEAANEFTSDKYSLKDISLLFEIFGNGICDEKPNCDICQMTNICHYYQSNEEDDDDSWGSWSNSDDEDESDEEDDLNSVEAEYYCKAEPSGEVVYAKLNDSEISDLKKYYKKKKFDSLDWINSPGNMDIIEHSTAMFGCQFECKNEVTDHHELPTEDGFYLLAAFLSKYSIAFNFLPNDNEPFDESKFSTSVVEFRFGDFMKPYGDPFDYDLHYRYNYNGEEIEESMDADMIDRGIDSNVYVFQVKDGQRSMVYKNEKGDVTWGEFLD